MVGQRKDPEQILRETTEEALKERRGKLKIYLGAAPGVGKTYTMLHDALDKRNDGLDVVVGIAESHGRIDIESVVKNFEILPRKSIPYRGKTWSEFNLDAALQRNPALILIDEMAHSNAPGLRHAKRWQDIKECLERGIDVYTTLNVQHIESLKDPVMQIIQAPIHETVPDSMIEMANTIELVDLPPDELLKRLRDGKVYFPQQAELAIEHFFRKGNLIALRQLALRTTAERVSAEVLLYRQHEGITKIWAIKEKILVCVGPRMDSLKLIRAAKRIATSLQAEWIAVYVTTPQNQDSKQRNNAIRNLRIAEQLGAITYNLSGFDIVQTIIDFAHDQNVTQIMLRKHIMTRWRSWFRRNLADEVLRHSGDIDVYIMTGSDEAPPQAKPVAFASWKTYALGGSLIGIATAISLMVYPFVASSNVVIIYLFSLVGIALFGRIGLSIAASVLSVLTYDFLFVPPFYSFSISDMEYFLTLVAMLGASQVISYLTILTKRQSKSAKMLQSQTNALYTLSRQLTHTRGVEALVILGSNYIAEVFNANVMALLYEKNNLNILCAFPEKQRLNNKERGIAEWVYEMGELAGLGTNTLSFSKALYLPLMATEQPVGVLRVEPKLQQEFSPEQLDLLESCVHQIAMAIEVDHLQEMTQKKELKEKTEEARITLLAAISNNLHNSLRAIHLELEDLNDKKIAKITKPINLEIEKLTKLNNNILRIIQLERPDFHFEKNPESLKEVIHSVLRKSSELLETRTIDTEIPKTLPLISINKKLIQEVLINLIDNAVKFTPERTSIHIKVQENENTILVSVEDEGAGVAPEERIKLFDKFYKGKEVMAVGGLGLGLAICHKIINLHSGKIWVENLKVKGAAFRFTLPNESKIIRE